MSREAMGRLMLEASTGQHGETAKQLADEWASMVKRAENLEARIAAIPNKTFIGMAATCLANELTEAVAKDEKDEGLDISAGLYGTHTSAWLRHIASEYLSKSDPIDMVLHCPKCHTQHIDEPESDEQYSKHLSHGGFDDQWTNPPHRSHLCHHCGAIWRPADVCTNGVTSAATVGKDDTWGPDSVAEPRQESARQWKAICERACGQIYQGRKGLFLVEADLIAVGKMLGA